MKAISKTKKICLRNALFICVLLIVFSSISFAQNPFITSIYTADPSAHVWADGRIYVYASHDIDPNRGCDLMDRYHVFSSADMVNWVDEGEILHSSQVPWGRPEGDFMWAPDCAYKNGTYYFYFPHPSGTDWNNTWKTGVATSTNPARGFTCQGYIPGLESLIDPAVFVDDDGQAYFYYGGGGICKGGKLKDNMMEIDGAMQTMAGLVDFHEAAWVHKYNGLYYLSYADNHSDATGDNRMRYATSTNPLGPWTYRGIIMDPTDSYCAHGSIVEYKGQWYVFYFNSAISKNDWLRSICVDRLYYNPDGTIQLVTQTTAGVPPAGPTATPIPNLVRYEAENAVIGNGATLGTDSAASGGRCVRNLNTANSYVQFNNVNGGNGGRATVHIYYASNDTGAKLNLTANNIDYSFVNTPFTGGWSNYSGHAYLTIPLQSGATNTIKLTGGNFGANLDYITVSPFNDPALPPPATPMPTPTPTPLPPGSNVSLYKPIVASSITQNYVAANANDGNATTYWEGASNTYPNTLTVDLGSSIFITRVVIRLNPATIWGTRTQTLSVSGSTDNVTYTTIVGPATYTFNPATNSNTVTINFTGTNRRYVRLNFTANSGATAGQVAEFEVYSGAGATPTPTRAVTASPTPTPISSLVIPGTIESENYSAMSGIDTEQCSEGTLNIGWTDPGDWLDYIVNVASSGTYIVNARVASPNANTSFKIQRSGVDLATIMVPNTGGWQNWTTVTTNIIVNAGVQTLRTYCVTNGFNINYINYTVATVSPTPTPTPVPAQNVLDNCNSLNGWSSSNSLTLDTSDKKEGTASIQSAGSGTDEFRKTFSTPVNSGVTAANGYLQFWYYVSDVSKFNADNQVELGSGGQMDTNEYTWSLSGLANGWNFISLKISNAAVTGGTPNLSAINWFRIYHYKNGSVTTKIDGIQFSSQGTYTPTPTPTKVPGTPTPTPTPSSGDLIGKIFAGYQGWFNAAGDGSPLNSWFHWSNSGMPGPGNVKFELYPDVREYTSLYQTNLGDLNNGQPARLFSSYNAQTVNKHFEWMQAYGIDGAAFQRFGTDIQNPGSTQKATRDAVAANVKNAAQTYSRKFYIMYDLSGMSDSNFVSTIQNDWTNGMIGTYAMTSSPAYSRQNGKPVVCIWGIGFNDGGHPFSTANSLTLINWFKSQGCYVIGGVPAYWRQGINDSRSGYLDVYRAFNMISPWVVGRFKGLAGADDHLTILSGDLSFCQSNGIDYQPVMFPGFAWSNWNGGARNDFPRLHGDFIWRQAYNIKSLGISTGYIAMFDEYDEGTAIAKAAENSSMIPNNQYFLTLDADGVACSSDFYLRLTGDITRMFKGQIPLTATHPTSHR